MTSRSAGLVLAAGAGTRFGASPKLLAELDGRPLLEHVVGALAAVQELEPIVVVLGAHLPALAESVDFGRAWTVVCPDWELGLSASLRCGVAALPGAERVLVALGDTPRITPEVVRRVLGAVPGARATYHGVPGHPVLLGPKQLSRISQLSGDVGARQLFDPSSAVECGDLASGRDVDTIADLEQVRRASG